MTKAIWCAYGNVRGYCGHQHRSREAAERCVLRDQRFVARSLRGGWSDMVATPANDAARERERSEPLEARMARRSAWETAARAATRDHPPTSDRISQPPERRGAGYVTPATAYSMGSPNHYSAEEATHEVWWIVRGSGAMALQRYRAWARQVAWTCELIAAAESSDNRDDLERWLEEALQRMNIWRLRSKYA